VQSSSICVLHLFFRIPLKRARIVRKSRTAARNRGRAVRGAL
jgi:hypothetical protein